MCDSYNNKPCYLDEIEPIEFLYITVVVGIGLAFI